MTADCAFCKIVAGELPSRKVYETDTVLAFHDINPAAPTHILIIPKKHITGIAGIDPDDAALVGEVIHAARLIAEQEGIADSFRLVANNGRGAGQSVFHLHFHLLAGRSMRWPPG